MPLQSVGVDGVTTIIPGWTDQSNTPYSSDLESSGGGTLGIASTPAGNNYLAWSMIPEDAIASNSHTSTQAFLVRVVAATGGPAGHLDMAFTTLGTVSNAVFGIYNAASFAVGPLAWTAEVHASLQAAGTMTSLTWNGASSPASINLQAGATYWIYYELTFSTGTNLAGSAGANAISMNPNLTASATNANNSMVLTSGGPTSLTATTTLTPQTSWANNALKTWFALRA